MFRQDLVEELRTGSVANRFGGPDEHGMGGGEARKDMKKRYLKRCIAIVKVVGAGDEGEKGGPGERIGGVGACSDSTSPQSLQVRMQEAEQEFQRFTLERGLDNDANTGSHANTGSRHHFTYPTLARLAMTYLVIPASPAALEWTLLIG